MLSNHAKDCLSCSRNQSCELQALGEKLGVTECRLEGERTQRLVDVSPSITRDTSKCILCRRCVTVCKRHRRPKPGLRHSGEPLYGAAPQLHCLRHVRPVHRGLPHRRAHRD